MSNPSFKPAGIPQMFPYLIVQDAEKSMNFYKQAFGFSLRAEPAKNDQGKIQHAEMKFGDEAVIMFAPEAACEAMDNHRKSPATMGITLPLTLYVYCRDVDAFYKNAIDQGAVSTMAPNDGFWGDRICNLVDPDGYEWMFATHSGRKV